MRSFSLIKTNVGLTTNIKIMVDSKYNLYLDSIDTNSQLSDDKFKKVQFNSSNYYDELIPYFYNGLDPEISYQVKDENDASVMYNTFDNQIDDLYIMGCNDIVDNKYYTEDYEYFAPLYVSKSGLPKYFAIFRIDGPGILSLTSDNFRNEIINNLKSVKVVDLTRNTPIGQWLYNNTVNNKSFPLHAFEIDFRESELSYWNGIDYINGCYTQNAYFFENIFQFEKTYNDLEKFVYDGFKNNKIVYPHIYNLSFLFDDQPATTTSLRPWSLNRYCGFYLDDMVKTIAVSTYLPSVLTSDAVIISGNIITNSSNVPFNSYTLGLPQIYIEYMGNFYPVNKIDKTTNGVNTTEWRIITDIDLTGQQGLINKNIINIDANNKLSYVDGTSFIIDDWNTSDVWLIEIDNKYHNIQFDNGDYYIYTDYGFNISSNQLTYYVNYPNPTYSTTINVYSQTQSTPLSFPIYKCQFTDIKNIDNDPIETTFADFEYDKSDEVVQTDESKMHLINLNSTNNPKSETDYIIGGQIVNIPVTSHYAANSELFRLLVDPITGIASTLNNLWRKNHSYVKWGFKNSISSNDYPYLLNNSFVSEDFNRTTDPYSAIPERQHRNLDYFYTINSSTSSYSTNTLHVENIINNNIDGNFFFDLNQYINNSYDYFTSFFERSAYLDNSSILKNVKKYSYFNSGDSSLPNITSFRGLKFLLYDVSSIKINNGTLQTININSNNSYEDYKFNILLSKNQITINTDVANLNNLNITASNNTLQWNIIDYWKSDKTYATSSVVNYYDILYTSITSSNISDPNINPATSSSWVYFTQSTLFWNPTTIYATYSGDISSVVYNSGEYYYFNGLTTSSFYNPASIYASGSIVKFQNKNWISTTSSNVPPDSSYIWRDSSGTHFFWNESPDTDSFGNPLTAWTLVELWDEQTIYSPTNLSVYNDVLYQAINVTTMGITPDTTTDWLRFYSFVPDNTYIYGTTISSNNVIYNNNRYYLCTSNTKNSKLDNGINIYINQKYKNVMVNIYYNDNTLPNLSNIERDALYKDLYSNITAFNFSNAINDVTNNYGFANNIKYIILGASYSYIYDFGNINSYKNLPSLLTINGPDQFLSRILSLNKKPSTLQPSQFDSKMMLNNGNISTIDQVNYYNNLPLASIIDNVTTSAVLIPNYSGINNKIYNIMYRLSGQYDPIFLDIDIFKKGLTYSGNFIFDTNLTNFGIAKNTIISKVNRTGSVLKLKNSPNIKSIYPMIDEFGYTTRNIFIFKSSWDTDYFTECTPITVNTINTSVLTNRLAIFNPISLTPNNLT